MIQYNLLKERTAFGWRLINEEKIIIEDKKMDINFKESL